MQGYLPPDFIDNQNTHLSDVLVRVIRDLGQREADFASGFFNPKVWQEMGPALKLLERFRLLLGRQPELEYGGHDRLDLHRYYRGVLQNELEQLSFDSEHARMVDDLLDFLRRDSVEVRLFTEKFLHAKAYVFPHLAIVGSSNFTPAGLSDNTELNLVRVEEAVSHRLRDWFEDKWAASAEYKDDLIAALEASKFGSKPYTPYQVFIRVLYEYFRERLLPEAPEGRTALDLATFQQEGLEEAKRLLERHRGVLIADAVGLGKTYIGMGLLEHYLLHRRRRGHVPRGLVVGPAQVRDTVWIPKLREYGLTADVLSQEEVGREDFDWRRYTRYDLVLVDESHNFRNPGTNRYRNLRSLIIGGRRDKLVALMTATPINNSIWDLYHQLLLMARGGEAYYREFGVANLRGFFARVDKNEAELFDLLEETTVRRSRYDIRKRQEAGEVVEINGRPIRFPDRELRRVDYDLEGTYQGWYREIASQIEDLNLVSYNIEAYKAGAETQTVQRNEALIGIMKTMFLKRLESSLAALEESVRRQKDFQERFLQLLRQGRLLDASRYRQMLAVEKVLAVESDEDTAVTDEIIAGLPEVATGEYDLTAIEERVRADLSTFETLLDWIEIIRAPSSGSKPTDNKLDAVKRQLVGPLRVQKMLLFTYYRDTALYLRDQLRGDAGWLAEAGNPRIDLITGDVPSADRNDKVRRFAPRSNMEPEEYAARDASRDIDILISTDVLSEGQNLQDAGVILNYDLHWNPVRMIQRAGRVDRIGQTHDRIIVYNCFPEQGLEELLGLVERLQRRIRDIERTVGLDASVMGEVIHPKSLEDLRRIRLGDRNVLEELDQAAELTSTEEMKLPLLRFITEVGEDAIREIPTGIHSGKEAPIGGVFFAFKARDRHFWRFYPVDGGEVITDKRKIFRWIECTASEPRSVPSPEPSIFPLLEKATQEILDDLRAQRGTAVIRMPLTGINKRLYDILNSKDVWELVEEDMRNRLNHVLETVPLRHLEREGRLRDIVRVFESGADGHRFVAELDASLTEHDLYPEADEPVTLEEIKREDLQVVTYEWLTSRADRFLVCPIGKSARLRGSTPH